MSVAPLNAGSHERPDVGTLRAHLSRRQRRVPTIWLYPRSCGSNLGGRPAQTVDQIKDASEHGSWQRRLGELEDGVSRMAHQTRTGLDQALAQRGQ